MAQWTFPYKIRKHHDDVIKIETFSAFLAIWRAPYDVIVMQICECTGGVKYSTCLVFLSIYAFS